MQKICCATFSSVTTDEESMKICVPPRSQPPPQAFLGELVFEGRNTSSPKNACGGGYLAPEAAVGVAIGSIQPRAKSIKVQLRSFCYPGAGFSKVQVINGHGNSRKAVVVYTQDGRFTSFVVNMKQNKTDWFVDQQCLDGGTQMSVVS